MLGRRRETSLHRVFNMRIIRERRDVSSAEASRQSASLRPELPAPFRAPPQGGAREARLGIETYTLFCARQKIRGKKSTLLTFENVAVSFAQRRGCCMVARPIRHRRVGDPLCSGGMSHEAANVVGGRSDCNGRCFRLRSLRSVPSRSPLRYVPDRKPVRAGSDGLVGSRGNVFARTRLVGFRRATNSLSSRVRALYPELRECFPRVVALS